MNSLIKAIGIWWLSGAKYALSKWRAKEFWNISVREGLVLYGIDLDRAKTLDEVVRLFQPHWKWLPDPVFQGWDVIYPPVELLARGGEDCDGWAMTHAQAIEEALGPLGWEARIISYLAEDWTKSHHFAVAVDPDGRIWAIQPQPSKDMPADSDPIVRMSFASYEEAAIAMAGYYDTTVAWHDVRKPDWTK